MTDKKGNGSIASQASRQQAVIRCADSVIKHSYANSVNVSSIQEEIALNFGLNQAWKQPQQEEIDIELTNRVILNPRAAKRLATLHMAVIKQYVAGFGLFDIAPGRPEDAPTRGRSRPVSQVNLHSVER